MGMNRQDWIAYCLTYPDAYEDYPFDEVIDEHAWTLMRHLKNKRSFASIFQRDGSLVLNLKCDPTNGDHLRQLFDGIKPAYHMNKQHWISVYPGQDVPDDFIEKLIDDSWKLTKEK